MDRMQTGIKRNGSRFELPGGACYLLGGGGPDNRIIILQVLAIRLASCGPDSTKIAL